MITILISLLKTLMWIFIVLMGSVIIAFIISCCVVAGRISEKERNKR